MKAIDVSWRLITAMKWKKYGTKPVEMSVDISGESSSNLSWGGSAGDKGVVTDTGVQVCALTALKMSDDLKVDEMSKHKKISVRLHVIGVGSWSVLRESTGKVGQG